MKISYVTSHGYAERVYFCDDDRSTLTLTFGSSVVGAVTVNGVAYPLKNGEVKIPLSILPSGEYSPLVETTDGVYVAESFIKSGHKITFPATDDSVIRLLLKRCRALEEKCDSMIKTIKELESMCKGHEIFNFERKE